MKRFFGLTLGVVLFATGQAAAQNELDILRYSRFQSGQTARSIGLGGTGGSFGGDFSSLSINPAGIGVYRSSEIMITPTLRVNNLNTRYLGNKEFDEQTKLGLSNFGVVFTRSAEGRNYEASDWKAVSFGIGYNRLADFHHSGRYSASNNESSLTDIFSRDALANGVGENLVPPFGYLAYQGYLLDDNYHSIIRERILNQGGSILQTKDWRSKGGIDEWVLSLGGNYQEKLLLGMSAGILSYNYDYTSSFSEKDETGDPDNDFHHFSYDEILSTIGYGFNLKLGAIYVVNDQLRIGAAVHTPTWSQMNDLSDYRLQSNTENLKANTGQANTNPETTVQPSNLYEYDYSIRSPWRAIVSATTFLGTKGFITADYEFVDYASMKYGFSNYDRDFESTVNKNIRNTFKASHHLRIGIEGRQENFSGRLGFGYETSPFERSGDFGGDRMHFSAGVGARFGRIFMDLAYQRLMMTTSEYAYPMLASGVPTGVPELKYSNNLFAFTLGLKF